MHNRNVIETPEWINDLVIYEIATKGFTSPNGSESGNFKSLKSKMKYLHDLGITGIWLTGNQLCNPKHFYNIWTQYACIRPDQLDPTLGTVDEFKEMIEEAHCSGIKVFLDVITHGLMSDSPLVKEKPHWFKGGSWGMTDFDWFGGHKDLDEWWVNTWVKYVEEFGIDGFRLDVAAYRFDLWSLIRRKAAEIGHKIIIIHESYPATTGATDFLQYGSKLSESCTGLSKEHRLLKDVAGFIEDTVERRNIWYKVKIIYEDGTFSESHSGRSDSLAVAFEGSFKEIKTDEDCNYTYIEHRGILRIENVCLGKKISDIVISDSESREWHEKVDAIRENQIICEGRAPTLRVNFALRQQDGQYLSVQLSSHDNGWDGFPLDKNPYIAQGSRFVFGYGFMFAPAVPVFMAGEEFNADFVPLPGLSPRLFGEVDFGRGKWLYGSWIKWEQLDVKDKDEMLQDVKKMIRIRKMQSELIHPFRMGESNETLYKLSYETDAVLPVPYLYYRNGRMVLVAANPYTDAEVKIKFKLPESVINNIKPHKFIKVLDIWNEKEMGVMEITQFEAIEWTILRDNSANGGLLVIIIETCSSYPIT